MTTKTLLAPPSRTMAAHSMNMLAEGILRNADCAFDNDELNDSEKFALAFVAGVPFDTEFQDGKLTVTLEPCSVTHDGNGWRVVHHARQPA